FTLAQSRRSEGFLGSGVAPYGIRMKCRTPGSSAVSESSTGHGRRRVGATGASAIASRKAGEQFYRHRRGNHTSEGFRREVPVDAKVNGLVGRYQTGAACYQFFTRIDRIHVHTDVAGRRAEARAQVFEPQFKLFDVGVQLSRT